MRVTNVSGFGHGHAASANISYMIPHDSEGFRAQTLVQPCGLFCLLNIACFQDDGDMEREARVYAERQRDEAMDRANALEAEVGHAY